MPATPVHCRFGPVRVVVLPHARGTPAEAVARTWIADALGIAEASLSFTIGPHGRPELGRAGLDCNWSHSGDRLAVALGEGVRVGIDIEALRPRPRALELAHRFFAPAEAEALAGLPVDERDAAFLRLWCAKESVLKAHGRGLAFGLDRLTCDARSTRPSLVRIDAELGDLREWRLEPLALPGFVGSVAWWAGGSHGPAGRG